MNTQEKIVAFLKKKSAYVSGEQLGSHLGVSRQALWKQINELKSSGYDIAAVPHLGYRLVSLPDRMLASEISYGLNTRVVGGKIYYYDTVPSTMDVAMELGMQSAADGTLVVAETQVKARGRLGRSWFSPKHKGIYSSIILKPDILPRQAPLFALLSAVAVAEAVQDTLGIESEIKWPNDLLIGARKYAGILTEMSAEMDVVRFIVVGLGVNVNNSPGSLPVAATSLLAESAGRVDRVDLFRRIIRRIEYYYLTFNRQGSKPILNSWRGHKNTLGKRIKLSRKGADLEGLAMDIDTDGSLLVRKDSGLIEKVMSGDITFCR